MANFTGEHKPRIPNDLYDHLRECKGWVANDITSRAKFAIEMSKRFNMTLKAVEEAIAVVFDEV